LEGHMQALFSIAFTGIFAAFIVAAVVGHVLLLREFVRPFTGKATMPLPMPSLQPGY
jgi:hypothetical protein